MASKSDLAQWLGENIGGHAIGRCVLRNSNALLLHLLSNVVVANINMLGSSAVGRIVALGDTASTIAKQINGSDG